MHVTNVCMCVSVCVCMCVSVCVCVYVCACVYHSVCVYIYIDIYTYMCVYIQLQISHTHIEQAYLLQAPAHPPAAAPAVVHVHVQLTPAQNHAHFAL